MNAGVATTWLGTPPSHWQVAPLYARYEVMLGKMLDAKQIRGGHLAPYLRNVDVQWDSVNVHSLPEMDFEPAGRRRLRLRAGDLLVCEGGEVGRTAMWRGELDECYYQKAVHRLRPLSARDYPRFFFYSMYAAAKGGRFVAGGNVSTIGHLTAVQLRHYRFAFPPSEEQRAIADFLDRETERIDALVAKKQRLIELLQEKRTALVSHFVTKGLDPDVPMKDSGVEWLGRIPSHWRWLTFGRCCTIVKGQVDPTVEPFAEMVLIAPDSIESGTGRILKCETAEEQGAISGKYVGLPGDVFYSKIRPALAKACLVGDAWLCSADMYSVRASRSMTAEYLLLWLLSRPFTMFAVLESMRVAMPKVNRDTLGASPLPVPPLSEQRAIVEVMHEEAKRIDSIVAGVRAADSRVKEYRCALITAAVTGQIDVRTYRAPELDEITEGADRAMAVGAGDEDHG